MNNSIARERLAFSTNAFVDFPLEYAVREIAQAGYRGIEILADTPHCTSFIGNELRCARIARMLAGHGLTVSNINANTAICLLGLPAGSSSFEPSLSNPDKKIRRKRLDYIFRVFDSARIIGADTVSITTGLLDPDISRESQIGYFSESIEHLLIEAKSRSIRVGIEAEPGLLIGTTSEAGEFVEQTGSAHLGINWDAGHAVVAGEHLPDVISRYGIHFFNIHIEDIRGGEHYHLIPGEGDIDFDALFFELDSSGYSGFFTVELYTYRRAPVEAANKAFSFLANM